MFAANKAKDTMEVREKEKAERMAKAAGISAVPELSVTPKEVVKPVSLDFSSKHDPKKGKKPPKAKIDFDIDVSLSVD